MSDAEWNPDRATSHVEDALVRLDEALAMAHKVSADLIVRLDIALQPEQTEPAEKEGAVSPMLPTSVLIRRLDEATRSVEGIARRCRGAMNRLDI